MSDMYVDKEGIYMLVTMPKYGSRSIHIKIVRHNVALNGTLSTNVDMKN